MEKHAGVVLKGKAGAGAIADRLILKKARWILDKLEVVKEVSRDEDVEGVDIAFNHSKFIIRVKHADVSQKEVEVALQQFYKEKAVEKIGPRVERLARKTGLVYSGLQFRKMSKCWGSCAGSNRIILNTEAVKLPFSLIDYLIVHELVHTVVKDHSKSFWTELERHERSWMGG